MRTDGGTLVYNPTGFARNAVLTHNGYTETDHVVPSFGWTVVKDTDTNVACKVKIDGLTGTGMTWNAEGMVSKTPTAVVIQNGVYVGM